MNRLIFLAALASLLEVSGCGMQAPREAAPLESPANLSQEASNAAADALPEIDEDSAQKGQAGAGGDDAKIERKIIYNATVDLVVEDFGPVPEQVQQLVARHDGYVAGSESSGSLGARRNGRWTIRVPVARFGEFLDEVVALGELRSRRIDSREVTEEYYDVESRIRNKQKEEARLLEHLESSTGKLEDILAVERELSRVREELERYQGRMRVLNDLTAFSTLTLFVEEIRDYEPAQAATFGTRISRTFERSIALLIDAAQALVLLAVAVAPWLAALGVPILLAVAVIRRLLRMRQGTARRAG